MSFEVSNQFGCLCFFSFLPLISVRFRYAYFDLNLLCLSLKMVLGLWKYLFVSLGCDLRVETIIIAKKKMDFLSVGLDLEF